MTSAGSAPHASRDSIDGVIDAITPTRIHGWAWDRAAPGARLRVCLLLDGTPVAETHADRERADLAPNGIGDGRHAFEFEVDPSWSRAGGRFRVEVACADGSVRVLARAGRARAEPDGLALVATQLASVVNEQQRLRLELVERSSRPELPEEEPRNEQAAALADLTDRLTSLEVWLARLDERLGRLPETAPASKGGSSGWPLVLAALLSAIVVGALAAAAFLLQ
jgi:hypothetical protein